MDGLRTGLRHRLERALRRVEEQHRLLRDVDAELSKAAAERGWPEVASWLERKRDALLAHFDWEEQVVFPAVHGLAPGTESEIAQLEREHATFIERLVRTLEGSGPALADELAEIQRDLERHERHEERLVGLALTIEQSRRSGPG